MWGRSRWGIVHVTEESTVSLDPSQRAKRHPVFCFSTSKELASVLSFVWHILSWPLSKLPLCFNCSAIILFPSPTLSFFPQVNLSAWPGEGCNHLNLWNRDSFCSPCLMWLFSPLNFKLWNIKGLQLNHFRDKWVIGKCTFVEEYSPSILLCHCSSHWKFPNHYCL